MTINRAVYPGTFDPLTRGHEDLVRRASRLSARVVPGPPPSRSKKPFFSLEERVAIARELLAPYPNVEVQGFDCLLMDFLRANNSSVILRGLRAVSDFEYEFQMAGMNRNHYPYVETVFLTPAEQYMFISATMVREIASLGGDVAKFVQPLVAEKLAEKLNPRKTRKRHGPDHHRRMHQLRRVRARMPEQRDLARR